MMRCGMEWGWCDPVATGAELRGGRAGDGRQTARRRTHAHARASRRRAALTAGVAAAASSGCSRGSSAAAAAAQVRRFVQDGQRITDPMSSTISAVSCGGALL